MEISSKKPDGIEIIKNTLASLEGHKGSATTTVTYIDAPRSRIVVSAENFKIAEKFMSITIEKTRSTIEKQHGTFNYVRQESKKSHQLV